MIKVRHPHFRNEEVSTSFGVLVLDERGFVVNAEELGIGDEELASLPGFINDNDFPVDQFPLEPTIPGKEITALEDEKKDDEDPLDQAFMDVVEDLLTDPDNLNTQGNLDLEKLNTALHEKGLPKTTGAQRDLAVKQLKNQ